MGKIKGYECTRSKQRYFSLFTLNCQKERKKNVLTYDLIVALKSDGLSFNSMSRTSWKLIVDKCYKNLEVNETTLLIPISWCALTLMENRMGKSILPKQPINVNDNSLDRSNQNLTEAVFYWSTRCQRNSSLPLTHPSNWF